MNSNKGKEVWIPDSVRHDHDYSNTHKSFLEIPVLESMKQHNRIVSVQLQDPVIQNLTTYLNQNGVNVSDVCLKRGKGKIKRMILVGSRAIEKCQHCFKSVKRCVNNACLKKNVRFPKPPKPMDKCPKCDRSIHVSFMRMHLEKHERDHQKKLEREREKEAKEQADLTCGTCQERFNSKDELNSHLSKHPPYICEKCGKTFIKRETLKSHEKTHNNQNSYVCEFCGKCFKGYNALHAHLSMHKDGPFKCAYCLKVFKLKALVNRHIKHFHFRKYRSLCTHCGRGFFNSSQCIGHIRLVHLKEKPFECNICHKKFGRLDYLQNHTFHHTGELRPMRKPPKRRRLLQLKIQNDGKPVNCKFCGKLLRNMLALKRHLQTHVTRYACQFCPLTFSRKGLCQRHEKIHEDGTLNFFRCNVCWKRFNNKDDLDKHGVSHKNAKYSCHNCDKSFSRRYLLNHHIVTDHPNPVTEDEAEQIIVDTLLEASENVDTTQLVVVEVKKY